MPLAFILCGSLLAAEPTALPTAPAPRLVTKVDRSPLPNQAKSEHRGKKADVRREIEALREMEEWYLKLAEIEDGLHALAVWRNGERLKDGLAPLPVRPSGGPEARREAEKLRRQLNRLVAELFSKG